MGALWPAVAAIAASLTLIVLGAQWLIARTQSRQQEAQLLYDVEARWRELARSFAVSVLIALGPESAYVDATHAEKERYQRFQRLKELRHAHLVASHERTSRRFHERIEQLESRLGRELTTDELEGPLVTALDDFDISGGPEANELHDLALEHVGHVRSVLLYLAFIASLVLRGHLTPRGAYDVLGPEVVRRSRPIRSLLEWDGSWLAFRPGVVERVHYLLDALWAEAARSSELSGSEVAVAAILKRWAGTGQRSRSRLKRLARGSSGPISRWALRLELAQSEVLPRHQRLRLAWRFERYAVLFGAVLRGPYLRLRRWLSSRSVRVGHHWGALQATSADAYGTSLIAWVVHVSDEIPSPIELAAVVTDRCGHRWEETLWEGDDGEAFASGPVLVISEPLPYLMERSGLVAGSGTVDLVLRTASTEHSKSLRVDLPTSGDGAL